MNRTIKCCLIVVLLALAGCTATMIPVPGGQRIYYGQFFQKKALTITCDAATGRIIGVQYNTEVDPTVMAIVQAFEAGKKAAVK